MIFVNNSFGKTVELLHRGLSVSSLRREVISDNIANVDTPNFKRKTVSFESELSSALAAEKQAPGLQAFKTDPRHIDFSGPSKAMDVKPRITLDYLTTTQNNGNNVDIEEESMLELQNQMQYQIMTQAVSYEFAQVNLVLK